MESNRELKFCHITKCAGTYIENMGKKNNISWGRFHTEYGYWHRPISRIKRDIRNKYDWFMIVRNPYDRILSEYYCKWGGIGNKNIYHTKQQMNNYIINKIKNRNNLMKSGAAYHYHEQHKYLTSNAKIHIIKLENLNDELNELFKKYNIDIDVNTNTNTTNNKINSRESLNNNIRYTINDFSNQLINLINKVYYHDFKQFGYKMKHVKTMPLMKIKIN